MTVSTRDAVYSYLALLEDVDEPCIPLETILCLAQVGVPTAGQGEGVGLSDHEKQSALAHLGKCSECYAQFQLQRSISDDESQACLSLETLQKLAAADNPLHEVAGMSYREAALEHISRCDKCKAEYQLLRPSKVVLGWSQRLKSSLSPGGWVGAIAACLIAVLVGPGLMSQLQTGRPAGESEDYLPGLTIGADLIANPKSRELDAQSPSKRLERQTVISGFKIGVGEVRIEINNEELTQSIATSPTILQLCGKEHGEYACMEMEKKGKELGRIAAQLEYECQRGSGSTSIRIQSISQYHEALKFSSIETGSMCEDIKGDPCGCVDDLIAIGSGGSLVSQQ